MVVQIHGVEKQVLVGSGIKIRIPDTRWLTEATVVSINEEAETIEAKGVGFQVTLHKSEIRNVTSPEERTYQEIVDKQALP